jgi:thioredoxin 1
MEQKKTFNELIRGEKPVLVDFFATWCGPCKMMEPIIKELSGRVADKATIIKIDVDKNPLVASTYRIQGVPTLMLFKKGEVVWRQSGVLQVHQLEQVIHQFAAEPVMR